MTAAKALHKKYKKNTDVEITLIDKNPYHTLMTELHEVAGSRTEPEAVQVSFQKIFSGTGVNLVFDTINRIEFDQNKLISDVTEYDYDYLIIGAGGEPEFFGIPGVQQHSYTCWSLEDAIRIRVNIEERFRDAAKEPDEQKRRKLLTFAIAGAGFTGVELAGELAERRDVLCRKYHIRKDEVRIVIIEMKGDILPILPKKPQEKAGKKLERLGVEVMLNSAISEAAEGVVRISDGREVHTDTFIWTAGIHGSEFTAKIALTKGQVSGDECSVASIEGIHGMAGCFFEDDERYVVGQRGRILVNPHMRSVDYSNVYLVGDMIWYVHEERVLPQIVETAMQTGETAAHNISSDIDTKLNKKAAEKEELKPAFHGQMVSVGSRYGVANVMGVNLYGFFALALKHLVNMHYLFGIAGVNSVWDYMKHQFLDIEDGRSITRNHLAYKIPVYWALPLRIWLGAKWLNEGIKHIIGGWLNPGAGRSIFNPDPANVYVPGFEWAEAASAATPEGGAEAADYGTAIIEAIAPYTWFAETVLSPNPWLAFIMQAVIVLAQVAIGLALIGGLFTFLAAGVSILMCLAFIASGWGNPELLWYGFASILMLGGAGRGLGLDHYVMPWLKNWWNGTKLAKSSYLYTGEPRIQK